MIAHFGAPVTVEKTRQYSFAGRLEYNALEVVDQMVEHETEGCQGAPHRLRVASPQRRATLQVGEEERRP
ncbi:MAG: hypothetical protein IPL60_14705 [Ardenticatenia bacterium]|nr:hypothetical protein [Ardenticatenia bacterium]